MGNIFWNYVRVEMIAGSTPVSGIVLPHNIEAEQALLGALLYNNDVYYSVFEIISSADFYDPVHGTIYEAISKLINAGRAADPKTLQFQFENHEGLKEVGGGFKYLIDLVASVVTTFNVVDYARLLFDLAVRRRIIRFSEELRKKALAPDLENAGGALISEAEKGLYAIAERRGKEGAVSASVAYEEALAYIDNIYKNGQQFGVRCGIEPVDNFLHGFEQDRLYVFGARPSMGKTTFALVLAFNAATAGKRVLLNTLEMSRKQIAMRLIARLTCIPADKQKAGSLTHEDMLSIIDVHKTIGPLPFQIDHDSGLDVAQIRSRAIREKRRNGLDILIIDYLGLIERDGTLQNTNYQIEHITRALHNLAKELHIPIILLSQLSREVERRTDKRPMLSDLRDSGAIEQDADVIGFLYREEYYLVRAEPRRESRETESDFNDRYDRWQQAVERSRNLTELIIAKNRDGNTGTIRLRFEGYRCLFTAWEDRNGEATQS